LASFKTPNSIKWPSFFYLFIIINRCGLQKYFLVYFVPYINDHFWSKIRSNQKFPILDRVCWWSCQKEPISSPIFCEYLFIIMFATFSGFWDEEETFFVWSLFKKKIFRLIYPRRLKWRKINRGEPQNKIEPSILVVRATTQINQNKIICKMQLKNRKCLKWNHNWKLFGVKPKRRTRLHKLGFKPNPEILLFRTIKGTFYIFISFLIENFESSLLIFGPFSIEDF